MNPRQGWLSKIKAAYVFFRLKFHPSVALLDPYDSQMAEYIFLTIVPEISVNVTCRRHGIFQLN